MQEPSRTIPFIATINTFSIILRFDTDGKCYQPPGLTMPDGRYRLATTTRRTICDFTVEHGQVSQDIHNQLKGDLLGEVRDALISFRDTGVMPNEFLTTAEKMDVMLAIREAFIDIIDGQPTRHPEYQPGIASAHPSRDDLLMTAGRMTASTFESDHEGRLLKLLAVPTPYMCASIGFTDVAHLEIQLARLRALQAWQPAEPPTSSPAP